MSAGDRGDRTTPPSWQNASPPGVSTRVVPDAHGPAAPAQWSSQPPFAQAAGTFQAMTPLQPGVVLNNTYRVEQMLGRGGMGEVYRGANVHTGDQVAIKVIRPELVDDGQMRDLFLREAMALRKIRHPAIVSYEGASADASGRLYLVMDFVEGPSLAQLVPHRPLNPTQVRALRRRLAEGLQAAHDQNVVHRDLSPDNIILRGGDLAQATIIDFGIARRTDAAKTSLIGKSFAGKIEYAAPEQFGMFTGTADARSDIYALGLVLAAASLGYPLDMGASAMAAIEARKKVPDLSRVAPELRAGLARMLQPDPAGRPQSMREVAALDALDATGGRKGSGLRVAVLAACLGLAAAIGGAFAFADPVAMVRALLDGGAGAAEARRKEAAARQRELAARDEQAWQQASQADTESSYQAYLDRHPDGRYAAEAGRRLAAASQREVARQEEDELWRQAGAATTAEPLREYLRRYPDGRFASDARRKLAAMQSAGNGAQPRLAWSPVSCAAIPLWVPSGFACQASDQYTLPGSGGRFRSYTTGGTVGGWQTQVWMHEALADASLIVTAAAAEALPQLNATTRAGTDWSAPLTYGGAEFMTFRNGASNCVALRKPGARRDPGYAHVFTAVQCAPSGQPLFPNDIRATIDGVRLK